MVLSDLNIGQKAIVKKIDLENREIRRHLLDLGLTKGTKVEIRKKAPMGDPIDISLRDYELCVSKKELSGIVVKVIK